MVGDHQNDNTNNDHRNRRRSTSKSSTFKGYGEIVEVEGGHIVRSIGRKDRHSKVCTSKGPRDRRVRLSAHTAIQFYDVQDRLGFDRPSKAVDWLIKNAKAAIDELAMLPPWDPKSDPTMSPQEQTLDPDRSDSLPYDFGGSSSTSFLPPSLDSDSIADTIKSFFPITDTSESSSKSPIGVRPQDLRLSLQSIHDPILLHHHHQQQQHHHHHHHGQSNGGEKSFLSTTKTPLVCDIIPFPPWTNTADVGSGAGGYACNFQPPLSMLPLGVPIHTLSDQRSFFSQREPLQSSDSQSFRPWMDPVNTGFASSGFSGFRIPAPIQGQDEGVSENLPSAPHH